MMMDLIGNGRSETKRKIINNLLEGEKTLKQLSENLELSKQTILDHLNKMEEKNLIETYMEKQNNTRIKKAEIKEFSAIISINKSHAIQYTADSEINFKYPLVNQIPQKNLREQTLEYLKEISSMQKPLTIVIFGSVARGEANWKSDIDIALFTDKWTNKEEIRDKISQVNIEKQMETSMNPNFKNYKDIKGKDELIKEIKKDGIIIYTTREEEKLWEEMKKYQNI